MRHQRRTNGAGVREGDFTTLIEAIGAVGVIILRSDTGTPSAEVLSLRPSNKAPCLPVLERNVQFPSWTINSSLLFSYNDLDLARVCCGQRLFRLPEEQFPPSECNTHRGERPNTLELTHKLKSPTSADDAAQIKGV